MWGCSMAKRIAAMFFLLPKLTTLKKSRYLLVRARGSSENMEGKEGCFLGVRAVPAATTLIP